MLITKDEQRCHSKKYIKKPRCANNKPKKTQGQISIDLDLAQISGKNPTFPPRNPTFPEKIGFLSAKISNDLFLVTTLFWLKSY